MDFRTDELNGYERFAECGFSDRIIGALIRAGIDTPERLLSMAPDRIRLIQGIGPIMMKEIERYRLKRAEQLGMPPPDISPETKREET